MDGAAAVGHLSRFSFSTTNIQHWVASFFCCIHLGGLEPPFAGSGGGWTRFGGVFFLYSASVVKGAVAPLQGDRWLCTSPTCSVPKVLSPS